VLRCCSVVTPITALLFAGHLGSEIQAVQLNQVFISLFVFFLFLQMYANFIIYLSLNF
jgi:hypothetical protein